MGTRAKPARRRGSAVAGRQTPHKPKHGVAPAELVGAPSLKGVEAILNGKWGADLAREATAIVLEAQRSRREPRRIHDAAERFNRFARTTPIKLSLSSLRTPRGWILLPAWNVGGSEDPGGGRVGFAVLQLWRALGVGAVGRLKKCRACRKWFADESRNRSKKQCGPACASRWWDRGRRRRAGQLSAASTRRSSPRRG